MAGHRSFAASVVPLRNVNPEPIRKVAEIADLRLARLKRGLPSEALPFGEAAKRMIEATFNAPSRHQIAMNAARALGGSDDTWERVMANATGRIDGQLLFACMAAYQVKFGKPFAFGGGLGIAIVEVSS